MTNWSDAIKKFKYSKILSIKYIEGKRILNLDCGHEFTWINPKLFPEMNERVACKECNNQRD